MRFALATTNPDLAAAEYEPVSADSRAVSRQWAVERNFLRQSASDWAPPTRAALDDIRQTCNVTDWDGAGAKPISGRTIALANAVVGALFGLLPKGTPAPDVIPEADGEICVTWSVGAGRVFSVSVGEHGNANYAGQFGEDGGVHGWQPLATENREALEHSLREIADHIVKVRQGIVDGRWAR